MDSRAAVDPLDELRAILEEAQAGAERGPLVARLAAVVTAIRASGSLDDVEEAGHLLRVVATVRGWGTTARQFESDLRRKAPKRPHLRVVRDVEDFGPEPGEPVADPGVPAKRRVEVQPDGTDTIRLAWATLLPETDAGGKLMEEPPIYRQAERLVMVADGKPVEVGADALRGLLAQRAEWWRWRMDRDGEPELVQCPLPPKDYPNIMATKAAFSRAGIPVLESVLSTPYLGSSGAIRAEPGYHPEDRVLLLPHDLELRRMPVGEAVALLMDWIDDFPFVNDAGRAHAIGLALTPLVRRIIAGPVPPVLIEAPKPRTGKTLLAQALTAPAVGWVPVSTLADSEEERGKALFSTLLKGRPVAILDNLKGRINSPTLEAVLTAWPSYEARILGMSQDVEVQALIQWVLTTNNGEFSEDMIGRLVTIRLDRHVERPDLLDISTLKHPDIKSYTMENRARLLSAMFSLVHHWREQGRPKAGPETPYKGTFEAWRDVIGGILGAAGIRGFLQGEGVSRAELDEWRSLMCLWVQKWGTNKATIAELVALCSEKGILSEVLGSGNESGQRVRLAKAIVARRDQVVNVNKQLVVDVLGADDEAPGLTAQQHETAGDGGEFRGQWRFRGAVRIMGGTYYQIARMG